MLTGPKLQRKGNAVCLIEGRGVRLLGHPGRERMGRGIRESRVAGGRPGTK